MSLLLALLSVTATCTPSPALADAGPERVRAYFAAINNRDGPAIGRFIRAGAVFTGPNLAEGMPLADVMTLMLDIPEAQRLEVTEARMRDGDIYVQTRTPSGATASANVRLDGGCISRFAQLN
ncbi:MAG TPA: hypothetical protein VMG08_04950 [Allosphingosinicella sp.]|nr:hypothetical protein [Allosphingosinicella sp.]